MRRTPVLLDRAANSCFSSVALDCCTNSKSSCSLVHSSHLLAASSWLRRPGRNCLTADIAIAAPYDCPLLTMPLRRVKCCVNGTLNSGCAHSSSSPGLLKDCHCSSVCQQLQQMLQEIQIHVYSEASICSASGSDCLRLIALLDQVRPFDIMIAERTSHDKLSTPQQALPGLSPLTCEDKLSYTICVFGNAYQFQFFSNLAHQSNAHCTPIVRLACILLCWTVAACNKAAGEAASGEKGADAHPSCCSMPCDSHVYAPINF